MSFRLPALVLVAGVALGGVVGCGSSTPAPAPGSNTSTPATAEHGAFAHCLGEHGVIEPAGSPAGPQPGPVTAPNGVDPSTWEQAMQACSSLAPGPAGP